MTRAELAEIARVELVCAMRPPRARGSKEPDLGAAHRAVCAILAGELVPENENGTDDAA